MATIGHVINAAYNVRTDLLIQKAMGNDTISEEAFKAMIDRQKDLKDEDVISAIDDAFDEFFDKKNKEKPQEMTLKFMEEEIKKSPTLVLQDKNAA